MVEMPNEIQAVLKYLDNGMVWVYIGIFFVLMYLLISLLTWSFIKPLKYLGVPTILVGILLIVIKLLSRVIANGFGLESGIINLLPLILKPLLIYGIVCTCIGILMIVLYRIINKKQKNKEVEN